MNVLYNTKLWKQVLFNTKSFIQVLDNDLSYVIQLLYNPKLTPQTSNCIILSYVYKPCILLGYPLYTSTAPHPSCGYKYCIILSYVHKYLNNTKLCILVLYNTKLCYPSTCILLSYEYKSCIILSYVYIYCIILSYAILFTIKDHHSATKEVYWISSSINVSKWAQFHLLKKWFVKKCF